ncbi:protein translocase subunit SecD, partial [Micromonospora aurantiaca]|nr:protein translocase subunit SecD [Micromonospora aurantiaca]
ALTAPTPKPSGGATPSPSSPLVPPSGDPTGQGDYPGVTDKAVIKQFEALDCYTGDRHAAGANDPNRQFVAACDQDEENGQVTKYILGPVRVLGENVDEANAMPPNAQQGQASWSVSLKFDGKGAKQFGAVT